MITGEKEKTKYIMKDFISNIKVIQSLFYSLRLWLRYEAITLEIILLKKVIWKKKKNQMSVIKYLLTEKYKSWKICRIVCNVYVEPCFSKKKNLYNWAKHSFAILSLSQKNSPWCENTLTLW